MKISATLTLFVAVASLLSASAAAQTTTCTDQGTWTTQSFPYTNGAIDMPILLTDGRAMMQYVGTNSQNHQYQDWYALTPDSNHGACYTNTTISCNATWSELASLFNVWQQPYQYGPNDGFASAVMADGRVIVQGGENNSGQGSGHSWTILGAIYDPVGDSWSQLPPPGGINNPTFPYIGDAQTVVLPSNTYMVASCGSGPCDSNTAKEQALYNETTQRWTVIPYPANNKSDHNSEEGYTLLPNGQVLTVDIGSAPGTETFDPSQNLWSFAGNVPNNLVGNIPAAGEVGPAVLLPNGKVLAVGAAVFPNTPSNTDIYDPSQPVGQRWSAGPTFPSEPWNGHTYPVSMGDEPAVLLPDGNVLLTGTNNFSQFYLFEFDYRNPNTLCQITNLPSTITGGKTFTLKTLLLPSGQILVTTTGPNYYIYTPGGSINPSWQPTIIQVNNGNPISPGGKNYMITGTQFNGLSQAVSLGDDYQAATNYPLVQITDANHHVFYARSHNHSTMAVATGSLMVWTEFDVPSGVTTGQASVVVIANGIASNPFTVTVS